LSNELCDREISYNLRHILLSALVWAAPEEECGAGHRVARGHVRQPASRRPAVRVINQNSVARMLAGASEVLNADVAPLVDDRFALMQVRAISELLINLSERVDWRPEELAADAAAYTELIAAASGRQADPQAGRDALLGEAADALERLGDEAHYDAVAAVLRRQTQAHARSLHSTMYKATPERS
jgi:hypothetical protein